MCSHTLHTWGAGCQNVEWNLVYVECIWVYGFVSIFIRPIHTWGAGCQYVKCILVDGIVCILSHLKYLRCRVSECCMYSSVWYRMYILTPYTSEVQKKTPSSCRKKVMRVVVYSHTLQCMYILTPYSVCRFSHPIVCVYSHTLHIWGAEGNTQQLSKESDANRMYIPTPYSVSIFSHPIACVYSKTLHIWGAGNSTPKSSQHNIMQIVGIYSHPTAYAYSFYIFSHPTHLSCR